MKNDNLTYNDRYFDRNNLCCCPVFGCIINYDIMPPTNYCDT